MRRLVSVVVIVVVVVASALTSSALFTNRHPPFLDDTDRDVVCAAALRYQPPDPPSGDAASHTATSTSTAAIRTNVTGYIPGQPLLVTVSAAEGVRGLLLQGRRKLTNLVVGQFVVELPATAAVDCEGPDDTLVAWYGTQTGASDAGFSSRSFVWIPPDDGADGQLEFIGTIFSDVTRYWTNVTSAPLRKGFLPIDLSGCGKTKGCFRYTTESGVTDCDAQTCDYVLTYHVTLGDIAHFELSGNAGWLAVGFSSDDRMGGEDVLMCLRSRDEVAIQHYYNNVRLSSPTKRPDEHLRDKEWELNDDGRLSCRFSRPMKVDFETFDLNNNWYQLYAWGPVSRSGDTVNKHTLETPPTSSSKITVRSKRNELVSGATTYSLLSWKSAWIPAHNAAIVVVLHPALLLLLLRPSSAFAHF